MQQSRIYRQAQSPLLHYRGSTYTRWVYMSRRVLQFSQIQKKYKEAFQLAKSRNRLGRLFRKVYVQFCSTLNRSTRLEIHRMNKRRSKPTSGRRDVTFQLLPCISMGEIQVSSRNGHKDQCVTAALIDVL
jgi:hypothetical protein